MTQYLSRVLAAALLGLAALLTSPIARADDPLKLQWLRQFGTPDSDECSWLSLDATGRILLSGSTEGNLGAPNAGGHDIWVSSYSASGDQLWVRQIGTPAYDVAHGVSADSHGELYVSGSTEGNLVGPNKGVTDVFIAKYNAAGEQLWSRQFGTGSWDDGWRTSVDSMGNAYIAGSTKGDLAGPPNIPENGFLAKYDASGNQVWIRQRELGSNGFQGVVADGMGQVYVSGTGEGSAGYYGAILSKYDELGNLHWTRHAETDSGATFGRDTSTDEMGNVYLSGSTQGVLAGDNQGNTDAFLTKYSDTGELLWTRQLGTAGYDEASSVFADSLGNTYVAGYLEKMISARPPDAFVAKYDGAGELLWTQRIAANAGISSIASDVLGNVYVAGSLGDDVFLAKYSDLSVPEPSGLVICGIGVATALSFTAWSGRSRARSNA